MYLSNIACLFWEPCKYRKITHISLSTRTCLCIILARCMLMHFDIFVRTFFSLSDVFRPFVFVFFLIIIKQDACNAYCFLYLSFRLSFFFLLLLFRHKLLQTTSQKLPNRYGHFWHHKTGLKKEKCRKEHHNHIANINGNISQKQTQISPLA